MPVVDPGTAPGSSALQRFIRRAGRTPEETPARCDLCGEPIPGEHRHVLEVATRRIQCACRACSLLFDREAASMGRQRLIPDRCRRLDPFRMTEAQWESLRLPVDVAFFFESTPAGQVVACYPSPAGPTESLLKLDTWEELVESNPVLREMQPDVEAVLVNRAGGARQYLRVPIDECYCLVGLLRRHWRGLSGGDEVWTEMARFFERLSQRAETGGM